jgi:hypothetical protein
MAGGRFGIRHLLSMSPLRNQERSACDGEEAYFGPWCVGKYHSQYASQGPELVKKSARWVPKLLMDEMKIGRVWTSEAFFAMIHRRSKEMLDSTVMMDESAVSFHSPETKQQLKQWRKKGEPGPIKAEVHATRAKQMVLAFSDSKGLICTNYMPRGTTVNAKYIMEALCNNMVIFKKRRPIMAAGDWFLNWDNVARATALFAGSCPRRLLPIPQGKEGAGRPHTDQGDLQEEVGGGCKDSHGGGLRRGFPAVVSPLQKVYCDRRQLC